uniref:Uncharacterized protein n=1 Tax=Oryza brachyantha TaxID=4533 RepID=J3N7X6_ORYBR
WRDTEYCGSGKIKISMEWILSCAATSKSLMLQNKNSAKYLRGVMWTRVPDLPIDFHNHSI